MNPVLAQLTPPDRPETLCTSCKHSIWYIGKPQTDKTALAAFCGALDRQVYNSQGDGRLVQTCAAMVLDD